MEQEEDREMIEENTEGENEEKAGEEQKEKETNGEENAEMASTHNQELEKQKTSDLPSKFFGINVYLSE